MRNLLLKDTTRNLLLTSGIATVWDGAAAGDLLKIFTTPRPADADTAESGTKLADVVLDTDAFGTPSAGSMALNGTWEEASAPASGTALWFRLESDTALERIDGNVGVVDDIYETSDATTTFTATTAVDSGLTPTLNEHAGRYVRMTSGAQSGAEREIVSNDVSGAFTLRKAWATTPTTNDTFVVVERYDLELTSTTIASGDKLVIDSFTVNLDIHNV